MPPRLCRTASVNTHEGGNTSVHTVRFNFFPVCVSGCCGDRFNVGSTPAEDDVISDGQPWVYFDSRPGADGKRMVVEAEMPATTFFVWQKPLKCHSDCTQSELAAATSRGTPEDCAEVSICPPMPAPASILATLHPVTASTCDMLSVALLCCGSGVQRGHGRL
jgi:uncharacterized Zn-binding protein involved in type VI secretion